MQTKMDSRDWDSALGEQCSSVGNIVKGTTAKVANLPQSLQSSHSPTATPRILEKESQTESENKNSSFLPTTPQFSTTRRRQDF